MNINKNLKNEIKIIKKTIKTDFSPKLTLNHRCCKFLSLVIPFDKSFHPVVLYENYFICIFMNINENLKNREKTIG